MRTENPVVDQGTIRENKLELVERLADDLAHEIKNPLHSMVINLEVLRRRLSRLELEPGTDLLRYASVLSSELERVNRRVDLLLRMVRPSRDNEDLASIPEVIDELRELIELECQRHGVTLEILPPDRIFLPDLPRSAVRQMLLSLMLETLDRTPRGGTLHLAVRQVDGNRQVEVYTTAPSGSASSPDDSADPSSFLTVARSLAERVGGQLDTKHDSPALEALDQQVQVGFTLTLPNAR